MSMTEKLCALVAECQSAAASADSGCEEADAEVHVKSEICSDGEHDVDTSAEVHVKSEICSDGEHDADAELIEVECNAQLMSQPFVALRDVFQHGGRHDATSPVGDPINAGLPAQFLLPLEAHLEDEPEVDDLFPQVHEDHAHKVDRVGKKVTRKRAVSVVSPPPSIVHSDTSVEHPSVRKQHAKSETLPRPPPASVCEDDLPLSVLHGKLAEHRSTSSSGHVGQRKNISVVCEDDIPLSVLHGKWAEHRSTSSSGHVGQRKNVSVVCEDDIPLSVLRAKWASKMAAAKWSATVTRSHSIKRKITVTRGKHVTQSEKCTVSVTPEKCVTRSVKQKVTVTPAKCETRVASRILQSTLCHRSRVKSCCHCDLRVHRQQALNKHLHEVHNFHPCEYAYCDSYWASAGAAAQHRQIHKLPAYVCDVCNKLFEHRHAKAAHRKTLFAPQHHCEHCDKSFVWEQDLKEHVRVHSFKTYKCGFCTEHFHSLKYVAMHERKHRKLRVVCKTCGETFRFYQQIKRHCAKTGC